MQLTTWKESPTTACFEHAIVLWVASLISCVVPVRCVARAGTLLPGWLRFSWQKQQSPLLFQTSKQLGKFLFFKSTSLPFLSLEPRRLK